jgi:hypothetical protein
MSVKFTSRGYRDCVRELLDLGYVVRGYAEARPGERHLIIRHDVDFCLDAALRMGELEAELGVRATYFVLVRSAFYNLFNPRASAIVQELQDLGHVIGLHFDPTAADGSDIESSIATEAKILALACGKDIAAVSFHRPLHDHLRGPDKLAGLWNAYARRFMMDIGYCSDSRGEWRFGDPLSHAAIRDGRALQLLTHPIWWNDVAIPPAERLRIYLREKSNGMSREIAQNSNVYVLSDSGSSLE